MAAMLHDIGKLAIPQALRQKSGKFTAEEYEQMKQHTIKGAQMMRASAQSEYETIAAEIALNHHEYWNGSGYPGHVDPDTGRPIAGYENGNGKARGKREEEIPVFGRVVAIADVYDALSCRRVFRDAMSEAGVLQALRRGAGKRYDPEMVEAFFARLDTIRAIGKRFPD
jgi:response regulator RpfG family c-di-GMP phosphodiesterase